MAEITSAEEAIKVAGEFMEPYYPRYRPTKAGLLENCLN